MRAYYTISVPDGESGWMAKRVAAWPLEWGPMYVQGVDSLIEAEIKARAMASRRAKADHAKIVSGAGTYDDPWVVEVSGTR